MNARLLTAAAAGLAALAACSSSPAPGGAASSAAVFCLSPVEGHSNPEAGARGDYSANVRFADVELGRDSVGYGATAGRSDEITISGGVLYLARPDGADGWRTRTGFAADEGAFMVQVVSPSSWRRPTTMGAVGSIDDLGALISEAARDAGCPGDARLAYRIEVRVEAAEWSLDTLPQRGDFEARDQRAVITGLFANVDQAKHFVTPGRNIHAHILLPDIAAAGHLKSARLAPGGKLTLQGS